MYWDERELQHHISFEYQLEFELEARTAPENVTESRFSAILSSCHAMNHNDEDTECKFCYDLWSLDEALLQQDSLFQQMNSSYSFLHNINKVILDLKATYMALKINYNKNDASHLI